MKIFSILNIVQYRGDDILNTIITSRETILEMSRELIREQGWTSVNIRSVAKACNISIGSIYNYFDNKTALIAATVESVWCDIFHMPEEKNAFDSFAECVQWAFTSMKNGNEKYPDFFNMHSMSFMSDDSTEGRQIMEKAWGHIREGFHTVLSNDRKVRPDAFDEEFTPEKFVDIIFSLIISALLRHDYDCSAILNMIDRILYHGKEKEKNYACTC